MENELTLRWIKEAIEEMENSEPFVVDKFDGDKLTQILMLINELWEIEGD